MPYGVFRFKQIIDECFAISKTINTSYTDLLDVSIPERDRMIQIIVEDNKKQQEELDKLKSKKH